MNEGSVERELTEPRDAREFSHEHMRRMTRRVLSSGKRADECGVTWLDGDELSVFDVAQR